MIIEKRGNMLKEDIQVMSDSEEDVSSESDVPKKAGGGNRPASPTVRAQHIQ